MTRSESIVKLAVALSKAQKNIGAATKGAANPFFKSKYADLGSVMEACKDALNAEGITVLQPVTTVDGKHAVETILLHESGEFISSVMTLELTKTNMQDLGSAISYARRYSLQSLVFIPAEDDDAEKSMARGKEEKPVRTSSSFARPKATETPKETVVPKTTTPTSAPITNGATKTSPVANGWE